MGMMTALTLRSFPVLVKVSQAAQQRVLVSQHPLLQVDSLRDLFLFKVHDLPTKVQETLKLAAALGPSFPDNVVSKLVGPVEAAEHLNLALTAGLLTSRSDCCGKLVWNFRHDSIHNAIYGLLEDPDEFAFQMGRKLLRKVEEEEVTWFMLVILRLLVRGDEGSIQDKTERVVVASLCLEAARKAVDFSGFHKSMKYLEFGASVLGPRKWREHYDLCLDLHNNLIEAYYGAAQFDKVEGLVTEVLSKVRWFDDSVHARMLRTLTLGTTKHTEEALDSGMETLSMLGEGMPANPTKFDALSAITKVNRLMKKNTDASILRRPFLTDQKKFSTMMMLNILFVNAYFARPYLAVLISCRAIEMTLTDGVSIVSGLGFAGFGVIIGR